MARTKVTAKKYTIEKKENEKKENDKKENDKNVNDKKETQAVVTNDQKKLMRLIYKRQLLSLPMMSMTLIDENLKKIQQLAPY